MNCWHCKSELIWNGDHDCEDGDEYHIVTNLSCPKCGSFVLSYHPQGKEMITRDDIEGFEYYDHNKESLRDPDTYLGNSPLDMVKHFARTYGQSLGQKWEKGNKDDLLRTLLVNEEYTEVLSAETAENMLKELADLVYVTYGFSATFGWDLDEAVRRVHASNMSKLGVDGNPVYRGDGKVLKGPNYAEPNLTDLI